MNYGIAFSTELQKMAIPSAIIPMATAATIGGSGAYLGDKGGDGASSGAARALGGGLIGAIPGALVAVPAARSGVLNIDMGAASAAALGLASTIGGIGGALYGAYKQDKPWYHYPLRGATFGLYGAQ